MSLEEIEEGRLSTYIGGVTGSMDNVSVLHGGRLGRGWAERLSHLRDGWREACGMSGLGLLFSHSLF